jgi:hypothetical protein
VSRFLQGGAEALWNDGNLMVSRDCFDTAYRLAEQAGDAEAMGLAAIGYGGLRLNEHRGAAAGALLHSRLRRALAVVDLTTPLAVRLRARLAGEADFRTGGNAAVIGAVEEARHSGDATARAEALSLAHHCLLGPEHAAARAGLGAELIAASFETGRRSDLLMGLLWRTLDQLLVADPHAERALTELRGELAEGDHLAVSYVVQAIEVMLAIRSGRFELAESMAAECSQRGGLCGDANSTGWYGAHLVCIRWYQGRIGELLPMLRELVNSPTLSVADNSMLGALAVAAAVNGESREAAGALARLELTGLPRSGSWLLSLYAVAEAAYLVGDGATAAAAYELLKPHAGMPIMGGLGVVCFGSAEHALGVASLATGDLDRAVGHLQEAVQENTRIGHWPAVALSRARLAEALALRGAGDDHTVATRELSTARQEADALGMRLPTAAGSNWPATGGEGSTVGLRRRGRRWEVELGPRLSTVEHSIGMGYLAALVANPGREIAAVDLAGGLGVPTAATGAPNSGQEVLDATAKRAYKARLTELESEIEELEASNDLGRAGKVRAERDWLIAELSAATGLSGHVRHFATSEERARVSVSKAIWRAVNRIEQADPVIGAALRTSIQTGGRCTYLPR